VLAQLKESLLNTRRLANASGARPIAHQEDPSRESGSAREGRNAREEGQRNQHVRAGICGRTDPSYSFPPRSLSRGLQGASGSFLPENASETEAWAKVAEAFPPDKCLTSSGPVSLEPVEVLYPSVKGCRWLRGNLFQFVVSAVLPLRECTNDPLVRTIDKSIPERAVASQGMPRSESPNQGAEHLEIIQKRTNSQPLKGRVY